eukprot:scaffold23478_cov61-Phaeocystis_antarctica.AAC.1
MALRCAPIHACRPHALPSVATVCTHLNARGGSRVAHDRLIARPSWPHGKGRPRTIQAQKWRFAALRFTRANRMRCRRWPLSAHTSMHEAARESRTTAS